METLIKTYLEQLASVPPLADSWFPQALAAARSGDADACRRICGGCLRLVYRLAEDKWTRWDRHLGADLLDLVQEGNAALIKAVRTFSGSTADEFLRHVEFDVRRRLHDLP